MSPILFVHICSAVVGLIAGALAMIVRKGSGVHAVAGSFFVAAMMSMSGTGIFMATVMRPNNGNVMGGSLLFYLVTTGWIAGTRRERGIRAIDVAALLLALAVGTAGIGWGLDAARSHSGLKSGYPAGLFFVFGSIALLFAAADVRMLLRGGVMATRRLVRHLWRIGIGFLFALMSLYPGNGRFFPDAVRKTSLAYTPHLLVIGTMIFWLVRLRRRRRRVTLPQPQAAVPYPVEVLS